MNVRPSILCPVDYSDASAGALRHAAALAHRFSTRLLVITVDDSQVMHAVGNGGLARRPEGGRRALESFAGRTFGADSPLVATMEYEAGFGDPASEILRVARERSCDLIIMNSHGLAGSHPLFFGSTTERVLRETTKPVLVTPPVDPGPLRVADAKRLLHRILVAVDLSPASIAQVQIARRVAEVLDIPLLLTHVVEPVENRPAAHLCFAGVDIDRHAAAEEGLSELLATLPRRIHPEGLVVSGDPAWEIARVARDRQAGLVIVGLHGSSFLKPRMKSVTNRLVSISSTLVLALPPPRAGLPAMYMADRPAVSPHVRV